MSESIEDILIITANPVVARYEAEIAELKDKYKKLENAVAGKLDRMNDIAPECGDSAEQIIADFLKVVEPIISPDELEKNK